MQELTITLGLTAALLHGVAYVLYNVQVKLGDSKPNAASWSVWAFLATLNALSYCEMSGDVVATLQFFTGSVACILTFLYVLTIGKFSRLKPKEWGLFTLGLLATVIWWKFRSATGANMIILVAVIISSIPTFEGVWRDPFKETPRSWMLWTLAYLVTTTNVILRDGKPIALFVPIVLLSARQYRNSLDAIEERAIPPSRVEVSILSPAMSSDLWRVFFFNNLIVIWLKPLDLIYFTYLRQADLLSRLTTLAKWAKSKGLCFWRAIYFGCLLKKNDCPGRVAVLHTLNAPS